MSVQQHELHLLTGSYALDALADDERAAFEKHLGHCPSCTEEVRGLRETAARLALATAIVPPPELRGRVLAAIPHTRQLPPATGRHRQSPGGRTGPRRITKARAGLSASIMGLAAAVAFLLVSTLSANNQLQQDRTHSAAIAAVLAEPDAHLQSFAVTRGGKINSVVSLDAQEAVVTTADLPKLSGTHVYQLWVINGKTGVIRSMGLLTLTGSGSTPVLASGVLKGEEIGLSIEPAGGSPQPTNVIAKQPVKA